MKKSWRLIKKKDRERKTKQVKEWASSLSEKEKALLKLKKTASQRWWSIPVSYYQWDTTNDGRVGKQRVDSTAADVKEDLIAQLKPFERHIYNIK